MELYDRVPQYQPQPDKFVEYMHVATEAEQVKDESLTKEELNLTSPQQIYITKDYNVKYQRAGSFQQRGSSKVVCKVF